MKFLRSPWTQVLALLFLFLIPELSVVVNHSLRATLDPDIWWHIRVGDWILQHQAVPHTAIYSQYEPSRAWIAYSWGFEVLVSWAFRILGLASIPVVLILFRGIVLLSVFVMIARISNRFWLSWLLTVAAAFPLTSVMVLRPIMFTILFFAVELMLLFEARRQGSAKPLWWLPLVLLVWANTHIQFVYGLALLGLFVGCELLARAAPKEWKSRLSAGLENIPALRLVLIFALSFLATLIGPYWGKLYVVILEYAKDVSHYNGITELVALSFRQVSDYVVLILLMVAWFVLGRKKVDLFTGSLLFASAITSFRSNRDQWFLTLVACAVIAESLTQEREQSPKRFSLRWQYVTAFVLSFVLAFSIGVNIGLTPQNLVAGIDTFYPIRATEFIRDQHLPGPMYNNFDWGGFLIFNLREYPVSIDGRNDLYGAELFNRMQQTSQGIDWQSDSQLESANFVLLQKTEPLVPILAASTKYKLVYADHLAVIFVKRADQKEN